MSNKSIMKYKLTNNSTLNKKSIFFTLLFFFFKYQVIKYYSALVI